MNIYDGYIIISPIRDEEAHVEKTIKSVVSQSIRPVQWIIVDDGSTDKTGTIIDRIAYEYPWITVIHRKDRGHRKAGSGVIEAFYEGVNAIINRSWAYIVKLDGDLSFQPDYFERCFVEFKTNPKLGIGGGKVFNIINKKLVWERHPMFHVRGATKIYRRECWEGIGRLIPAPGWDTLDEIKANMKGWETVTFAGIGIIHHRYTGAADGSWRDAVKNGLSDYICGYHPFWMLAKCLKRLGTRPYVIGSLGHLYGFVNGYVKKVSQVDDRALIRYLRQQQLKRLFLQSSIWQ